MKILWGLRALFFSLIYRNIKMPSYMGKPLYLSRFKKATFGKKVRIYPGLRLECHDEGEVLIKDDVSIGQNFHIVSAGKIIIEKGVVISGNVLVTNIDHEYRDVSKSILKQKNTVTDTFIGENCFIGYGVVIQAGTKLGKHCIVGSNAVVRGDFPDYSVIVGVPGRVIKRYDFLKKKWVKTLGD